MLFSRIRIHVPANEKGRGRTGEKEGEKVSVSGIRFRAFEKFSFEKKVWCFKSSALAKLNV